MNLPNATPYTGWHAALSENYVNIEDALGSAYEMYDEGTLPFIHVMFHANRQPDATIQNIAAGDYDSELLDWLQKLKAYCDTGRKAVVVYLPEFNGNWCVYASDDYSRANFITAWIQFVEMGRGIGLDETMVKWCWAPNDTGWLTLEDWYPVGGDEWVDLIGGSAYNWGGIFEGEPWESPAYLYDRYVTEVRGFTDRPIVITQTGAGLNDPRQRQWVNEMVDYTWLYQNIEGVIYYNEMMFALSSDCNWNDQAAILNAQRPDHWFKTKENSMRVFVVGDTGFLDGLPLWSMAGTGDLMFYVNKDYIPQAVTKELYRLDPYSIVIVGGTARVSADVEAALDTIAPTTRVAGSSRYTTPTAISKIVYPY